MLNEGDDNNQGQYLSLNYGDESIQLTDHTLNKNSPIKTIDVSHVFTINELSTSLLLAYHVLTIQIQDYNN